MAGRRGAPDRQKLDRLLQAKCHGEAWRRADAGEPIELIVSEVRELVGKRSHVLVETAGVGIGAWSVRPSLPATELLVAGILLIAAGANSLDELQHWIGVGRDRAAQRGHLAQWAAMRGGTRDLPAARSSSAPAVRPESEGLR